MLFSITLFIYNLQNNDHFISFEAEQTSNWPQNFVMINICVLYNTSSLARHVLIWYFLRVSSFSSGWQFSHRSWTQRLVSTRSRDVLLTVEDGGRWRPAGAARMWWWSFGMPRYLCPTAQVWIKWLTGDQVTRSTGDPVNRWTGEQVKRLWQSETVRIVNSPSFTLRYWVQVKFCSVSRDDLWSVFISDELLTSLIWHQVRSGPVRFGQVLRAKDGHERRIN